MINFHYLIHECKRKETKFNKFSSKFYLKVEAPQQINLRSWCILDFLYKILIKKDIA